MKRKMFFFTILLLFLSCEILTSQTGEEVKRRDDAGDYWSAFATYYGTNKEINFVERASRFDDENTPRFYKLSKFQNSMLWEALGKFDYKPGEIYDILIIKYHRVTFGWTCWNILCEVQKDYSINWIGHSNIVNFN